MIADQHASCFGIRIGFFKRNDRISEEIEIDPVRDGVDIINRIMDAPSRTPMPARESIEWRVVRPEMAPPTRRSTLPAAVDIPTRRP